MQEFWEMIMLVYSAIICIGIIVFPFTIERDKCSENVDLEGITEKKESGWEKVLQNTILLLAIGICIVGIIWLVWNKEYSWILLPVTVLTFFERLKETYMSMGVMKKTLHSNGDGFLSIKEQVSIMTIAVFVGLLNMYGFPKMCLQMAEGIRNEVMSDVLVLMILIFSVTVYYFLAGAILLIPIKAIIRLGRLIVKKVRVQRMTAVAERYSKWYQQLGNAEYISIKFLAWGLKEKWRLILVVPLLSFLIVIDVFFMIIIAILKIMMSIGEYILNGFVQAIKIVMQFSHWMIGISDRRILILTFRSALIFSLTSIVIVNRYMPIIKKYEAGTAVLEFCASAIVIPLVLSWIMEYRNTSN